MRCQLCAYEFDETQLRCHTSCPFNEHCAIICCPNCGYQTVNDSKSKLAEMMRRILQSRARGKRAARCPLSQLSEGEAGRLVSIGSSKPNRVERLQIFGLIPGVRVILKQRYPEIILQVGHTELAVERDVAAEILVEVLNPA